MQKINIFNNSLKRNKIELIIKKSIVFDTFQYQCQTSHNNLNETQKKT